MFVSAGKPDIKIKKPREYTADNALYVSWAISWYQTWASDLPKSLFVALTLCVLCSYTGNLNAAGNLDYFS